MINHEATYVTKTFLPPIEEYYRLVEDIWNSGQLTNNGSLSKRFVEECTGFLGIDSQRFTYVANGTVALQLSLRALCGSGSGEIITTPFSYVASTSAILWQGFKPVFADISPNTLNIDPETIECLITKNTKAILAVHVYGNPCDVEAINKIAKKYNLKTIYDAAHSFGVRYMDRSILEYGDASTLSFHATKLFHTIEGGGVYVRNDDVSNEIELMKRFGHRFDEHILLGINAKASEFHAAMGIINLKYVEKVISKRMKISRLYSKYLANSIEKPIISKDTEYNYAYYPVILESEKKLNKVVEALSKKQIFPRRYFYPSLNKLPYIRDAYYCPVSEDIAKRVLCLPLYDTLQEDKIKEIAEVLV